jgi:hypothetical protein
MTQNIDLIVHNSFPFGFFQSALIMVHMTVHFLLRSFNFTTKRKEKITRSSRQYRIFKPRLGGNAVVWSDFRQRLQSKPGT